MVDLVINKLHSFTPTEMSVNETIITNNIWSYIYLRLYSAINRLNEEPAIIFN